MNGEIVTLAEWSPVPSMLIYAAAVLVVTGGLVVLGVTVLRKTREVGQASVGLGIVLFIFALAFTAPTVHGLSSGWDHEQRERALSGLGYSEVDVTDNEWKGAFDGQFRKGIFTQEGGTEWIVVDLTLIDAS